MTTHCRYHCSRCGSHFTSLKAFDLHHEGSGANLKACTFPELEEPLVEHHGICKLGDPDVPNLAAVIYATADAERASEYFGTLKGRETASAQG